MELITIKTPHAPVRVIQGGKGPDLLFLHGAGGVTVDDPLLKALGERYRVHAPLLPGYGDSEECHELREMRDITLHYWDVVEALGLKDPIIAGQSMGGSIAHHHGAEE